MALNGSVITAIYFHNPTKRLFGRCVKWLRDNGYMFISTDELINILHYGKEPPKGAVWLSIDDGFERNLEAVLPTISKCKIPVTIFLSSGIVSGNGLFPWLHPDVCRGGERNVKGSNGMRDSITIEDVKRISNYSEVTVGSHTVNHIVTAGLGEDKLRFEITECKRTLESWTGTSVKCFAYPEGRFDGSERPFLKQAGYQLAATTQALFVTPETDPYMVPRFNVGDKIPFPEAICNMAGVWRSAISPMQHFLCKLSTFLGVDKTAVDCTGTQGIDRSRTLT
jgi:peptidoglycan/xylan/chitin deacetylase (PgdA/CDA1 family)